MTVGILNRRERVRSIFMVVGNRESGLLHARIMGFPGLRTLTSRVFVSVF